jgi:hypothetical protein
VHVVVDQRQLLDGPGQAAGYEVELKGHPVRIRERPARTRAHAPPWRSGVPGSGRPRPVRRRRWPTGRRPPAGSRR